ncbi:CapA family protein, partial [Georgenia sp. 10Sc9-8]|nr:CapA family protein [Georgenia halotolerans]
MSRWTEPRSVRAAVAAVVVVALLLIGGWWALDATTGRPVDDAAPDPAPAADPPADPAPDPAPRTPPPEPVEMTILSAGDVLPHDSVLDGARQDDGGYDFRPLMAPIQDWTQGADLALCSLEVPLAPPGTEPTGYPVFGAPEELPGDLADLGWDGCTTATNHALDRGLEGAVHTLEGLDDAGLGVVGTGAEPGEADRYQLYRLERAGREVVVAQLAATTLLNVAVPDPPDWAVHQAGPAELVEQARDARAAGADIVVVSMHWGTEYTHAPVPAQVTFAEELADSGEVDLVLGNHSHVPQPVDRLPGGPDGRGMWVAYSMGNLLSNQDSRCCTMETATGVLSIATVQVPVEGAPQVTDVEWAPVTVDTEGGHRVYPLAE